MALSFFIPFGVALVAAFVAYQSREEIVRTFAMIIMVINLLVSFVGAPWLLQLLILAASLGGMRYFCVRHSCQNTAKLR